MTTANASKCVAVGKPPFLRGKPMPECKQSIGQGWSSGRRQCLRRAVRDGYCTRHHPDYVAPSARAALEELEREENDPAYRAQKWLDEARTHRDECIRELAEAQDRMAEAYRRVSAAEERLRKIRYPFLFSGRPKASP